LEEDINVNSYLYKYFRLPSNNGKIQTIGFVNDLGTEVHRDSLPAIELENYQFLNYKNDTLLLSKVEYVDENPLVFLYDMNTQHFTSLNLRGREGYLLDKNKLAIIKYTSNGSELSIYDLTTKSIINTSSLPSYCRSILGYYDNKVFISLTDKIISFDLSNSNQTTIFSGVHGSSYLDDSNTLYVFERIDKKYDLKKVNF